MQIIYSLFFASFFLVTTQTSWQPGSLHQTHYSPGDAAGPAPHRCGLAWSTRPACFAPNRARAATLRDPWQGRRLAEPSLLRHATRMVLLRATQPRLWRVDATAVSPTLRRARHRRRRARSGIPIHFPTVAVRAVWNRKKETATCGPTRMPVRCLAPRRDLLT
jgi:hypothetical protein